MPKFFFFCFLLLPILSRAETVPLSKLEVERVVQKCVQEAPPPANCAEGETCHVFNDTTPLCQNLRAHIRLLINDQEWANADSQKMVSKTPGPFLSASHANTACGGADHVLQTGPITWRCRLDGALE